jgi:hypothetical protein
MAVLDQFQEDFVLLLEAGFVAVTQLDEDSATKLFQAAQVLDKEHTAPRVGLAAISLHKLEVGRSTKLLEEVIKQEPDNRRAGALLGISYLLSNSNIDEGERLLKEALADTTDPATQKMGELWLEVLEKGVRKADSPAQPKKPTGES